MCIGCLRVYIKVNIFIDIYVGCEVIVIDLNFDWLKKKNDFIL